MKSKGHIKFLYDGNRLFLEGKRAFPVNEQEMRQNIIRQVGIFKNTWSFCLILVICAGALLMELVFLMDIVNSIFSYESNPDWYIRFFLFLLASLIGFVFNYILLDSSFYLMKGMITYKLINGSIDHLFKQLIKSGQVELRMVINKTNDVIILMTEDKRINHYKTKRTNAVEAGAYVYVQHLFFISVVL